MFLVGMIGFVISSKVFHVWVVFVVGMNPGGLTNAICSIAIVVNISITTTCQTVTQRLELLVVATLVTQGLA